MVKFTIIIPKWLNDWLIEQAQQAGRSKTKQIEFLLKLAKAMEERKGD